MQKIFSVFCCTFVPSGLLNNDLINHLVVAVRFSKLNPCDKRLFAVDKEF